MTPESEIKTWTRETSGVIYKCSTDRSLLDLVALNAAFESDLVWWAQPLNHAVLERIVKHSLCFGLYVEEAADEVENGGDSSAPPSPTRSCSTMIGFGRLITDYGTFAYLTDVYVLKEHQGKGLGRWINECLNETLEAWPDLRRLVLFTRGAAAVRLYQTTLGAKDVRESSTGLVVMEKKGRAGRS
ncbi:hypothetical protein B0H63DRAFT_206201 [Podospora didyma]|uniref:N-acetyltransferase domain-containing protein n=1 Tax=Podospora didyma TaxID=330526 RepID=A0AAE0TVZ0_9PEZI|nr:hypothetical protein B0H63DRAFT_206201 [Podospora didyma]